MLHSAVHQANIECISPVNLECENSDQFVINLLPISVQFETNLWPV